MSLTEQQFYESVQEFAGGIADHFPVAATLLGDHRADDRLGDYSPEGVATQRAWLEEWLDRFTSADSSDWSLDGQIDREMMISFVKRSINGRLTFGYNNYNWLDHNPATVVYECIYGIYVIAQRQAIPEQTRAQQITSRLRDVPRVLEQGRALIDPAKVPPIWAMFAMGLAQQGTQMFGGLLPMYAQTLPALQSELATAAQAAAGALQQYAGWVQQAVLPQARGDFALGEAEYTKLLQEEHLVAYDTAQLLATGLEQVEAIKQEMQAVAAQVDPNKTAQQILAEAHQQQPTPEALLDTYRETVAAARQFLIDRDLITLPPNENLQIETTPLLLRPAIPYAALIAQGILGEYRGEFGVTPLNSGLPATGERVHDHSFAQIPVAVVHETYPGHYVHFTTTYQRDSLARKLGGFLFPTTVGGWAWYSEQMMEEQGYSADPHQKLMRLQGHLLGALWCVVEASLHTHRMTVEQAIGYLIQNGIDAEHAQTAVPQSLLLPGDAQCDLMGKLEILDIVAEYKQRFPQATLREVHDAIMGCGIISTKLIRTRLFTQATADIAS